MRQITLSVAEFYMFKEIAKFIYEFSVSHNVIVVKANSIELKALGY